MEHPYYLAYRPPKDTRQRQTLVQTLSSLGASRLHYSLWQIPRCAVPTAVSLLRGCRPIVLKRSREVVSASLGRSEKSFDLGTVMILAYRLPAGASRKRAALSRALWQSPALKIGRCLYLFPHLRAARQLRYRGWILSSAEVVDLCERVQIETRCFPYLRVVYPENHELIMRALMEEQSMKAERLFTASSHLLQVMRTVPMPELKIRKVLSAYRLRYVWLKRLVVFLRQEMGVDISPVLKKVHRSLASCRALLEIPSETLPK